MVRWAKAVLALCGLISVRAQACNGPDCVNLVVDGDSISAGAGSSRGQGLDALLVAALGQPVVMHNVAVSGRPVFECLRLYPKLVAPLFDPSTTHNVIAFHAGDNDIAAGRNANQTYAAFTAYVAAAHQQGWKVLVSTELRRPHFGPREQQELADYNRQLIRNEAGADAVVDLDTERRFVDPLFRANPSFFSPDQIHPSDGGYALMAAMIAPDLRRIAGR